MLNLYITRHGETKWNTEGRLQGWLNSPLTEKGILQGQLLNHAVRMYNIEKIYSSPSERALKTAISAKGKLGVEIEIMDELKEMHMGQWEGKTLDEIKEREPENFENYWKKPHLFEKNTGENFEDVLARTKNALDKIVKENPTGNVLIVTHGVTLKAIISHYSSEGFVEFWTKPVVQQASISLVRVDDQKNAEIILYGDTRHIDEMEMKS